MDWISQFESGNAALDRDRLRLAGLVRWLKECVHREVGAAVCARLLTDIVRHMELQFEQEERAMVAARYPLAARHAGDHRRLLAAIREQRKRLVQDPGGSYSPVLQFLETELPQHIASADRTYAAAIATAEAAGHSSARTLRRETPQH